jgi:hypothetical protein
MNHVEANGRLAPCSSLMASYLRENYGNSHLQWNSLYCIWYNTNCSIVGSFSFSEPPKIELTICLHRIRGRHANRTRHQYKVCKGIVEETKYENRDSDKDAFCICENAYQEPINIETE